MAGLPTGLAIAVSVAFVVRTAVAQQPPLQSGGLAPPPPMSGPPMQQQRPPMYPSATQRALESADSDDSGRGLEFVYFELAGGGQFASLDALGASGSILPTNEKTSGAGAFFGAASGVRLLYLTIGPRFRFGHFGDWNLWTLNLDVGWHVPLGRLEPYAIVGAGFAKVGRTADPFPGVGDVSTSGFNVRLGGGVDYYLSSVFSVGGAVHADLLRLSRNAVTVAPMSAPEAQVFASDASSLGLVVTGSAVLGLHF